MIAVLHIILMKVVLHMMKRKGYNVFSQTQNYFTQEAENTYNVCATAPKQLF